MKKYSFALSVLFLFGIGTIRAQYVTIPDANFVTYLSTVVPSAMSGNKMDTTNAAVLSLSRIDVENMGILNISGAQYFKALITLDCGNGSPSIDSNHITSLPALPATLDTLICGNNQIISLPALPGGLVYLACYQNRLINLPTLPGSLISLDCYQNQLTNLPTLPGSLTSLDCDNNQLTNMPALPNSLIDLYCAFNQLTNLPTLSTSLNWMACDDNQLTSLPVLPNSIVFINCDNNRLTSLPTLSNSLQALACDNNQLTNLPALPATLTALNCSANQITSIPALSVAFTALACQSNLLTSLPTLPSTLNYLVCSNNNISCFPVFPSALVDSTGFDISSNPFTCLPNYVHAMNARTLAYPLCLPGNPNSCASSYGIVGYTYKDMNSDCIRDHGDINLVNVPMQIYDNSNNLLGQTYTAINGVYDFQDTGATYKVLIDTTAMPFVVQCVHPGIDSLVTLTNLDTSINFSLTCKPGFDVGVQSAVTTGLIFPGVEHSISVVAGDMSQWYNLNCANGDSGTVQIDVSGPVTYVGPGAGALTPTAIVGNSFKYTIANYGAINNNSAFNLLFKTDTNAKAGDTICVYATVTPQLDNNPSNNIYQYCYYVINSHDPNNKTVYPVNVAPDYNGWFTYTIHFQNTGNAIAKNIVIKDTLASNLNAETFQLINYNHPNTTYLKGNIATFQFSDINLPDSAANSAGSIGFVQYRIKPKANLPNGTTIKNTADIYFDYNAAIVTNTTVNLFTTKVASVNPIVSDITCKVFPNPNNGLFTVSLQGMQNQSRVLIYNTLGQEVYSSELHNGNTQINLANKATGIYFYRIITENGTLISNGKMIVE